MALRYQLVVLVDEVTAGVVVSAGEEAWQVLQPARLRVLRDLVVGVAAAVARHHHAVRQLYRARRAEEGIIIA